MDSSTNWTIKTFSEDFISQTALDQISLITQVVFTPVICILGLVGNSSGTRIHSVSFHFYMTVLLATQVFLLVMVAVRSVPEMIKLYDQVFGNYLEQYMMLYCRYLQMADKHIAAFLLSVMSAERLCALTRPFSFKEYFLSKYMYPRITAAVCAVVSLTYLISIAFCFEIVPEHNAENVTDYVFSVKPNFEQVIYNLFIVETVVLHFICSAAFQIFNIAIPIAYYRIFRTNALKFQTLATRNTQMTKLTTVMLAIIFLFLLLSILDLIAQYLVLTDVEYSFDGKYRPFFAFFIDLSNIFTYINASCAAFIYIFASKHFWAAFKSKFCSCCSVDRELNFDSNTGCSHKTGIEETSFEPENVNNI